MREDYRNRRRPDPRPRRKVDRPPSQSPTGPVEDSPARGERLQKVLAAAGIASRRECEELILAGRVEVERRVVTTLGTRVDPLAQEIRVDGVTLPRPKRAYFLLNKPSGVVCTNDDPSGRARVIDLIKSDLRLFPVGRLDRSSEGLIVVTNDGALANRLTHPRYGIEKTYLARCVGHLTQVDFDRLRSGVRLAEGVARVESITLKKRHPQSSDLIIVLKEGRNREIRRILASVGHKVLHLRRIAIGPIRIEDLPIGAYRKLLFEEVQLLEKAARDSKQSGRRGSEARSGSPDMKRRPGARPPRRSSTQASSSTQDQRPARPQRPQRPQRPGRPGRPQRPSGRPRPEGRPRPARPSRRQRPPREELPE